ncbi:MAG: hypothetical protein HY712_03860 [candidate division NC10 bacterium]|nr:hypothetical protein [candidate division NC10 bacterium]
MKNDKGRVCELTKSSREILSPCPFLHPVDADWLYPVTGYCASTQVRGTLMIPSLEEYRTFCVTPQFAVCPRFGGTSGSSQDPERAREEEGHG